MSIQNPYIGTKRATYSNEYTIYKLTIFPSDCISNQYWEIPDVGVKTPLYKELLQFPCELIVIAYLFVIFSSSNYLCKAFKIIQYLYFRTRPLDVIVHGNERN
jgi:hypothetical protein